MRNTGLKRCLDWSPPRSLVKILSVLNKGFKNRGVKTIAMSAVIFAASYNTVSYQDMQSLAFGEDRWLVHLPDKPGQSIAAASMSLIDPVITGAVISANRPTTSNKIPNPADYNRLTTQMPPPPKAQTINRNLKGDRVISTTVVRPPVYFSAGSVIRRSSFLSPLGADKKQSLAFLKAKPVGEAMKIASVFQIKIDKRKQDLKNLPVMVASLVRESESSILSYLPEPTVKYSPFAAVLRDEGPISIIPKLNRGDHPWADDPLPKDSFSNKQQSCLATGIYFEARGEPARGQAAVAQVILNRVRNPAYPNNICGVVYQNKNLYNRCQFSFACDRKPDKVNNPRLWSLAMDIAKETTAGRIWLSQVGSSTHYHAVYVRPKWAKTMKKVGRIGLHIFYRTYGGGWS